MKDLFLSGEWEEVVGEATLKLPNFLAGGEKLGVSEGRAEVMERKAEYLGCILTEGLGCVGPEGSRESWRCHCPGLKRSCDNF